MAASSLVVVFLAGCFRWHPANGPPAELFANEPPTTVRVALSGGRVVEVSHAQLVGDTLVGTAGKAPFRMALRDVSLSAVRSFSWGKTIGVGLGVALAGASVFATANPKQTTPPICWIDC